MGKYKRRTNIRRAYLKQFSSSLVKTRPTNYIGGGISYDEHGQEDVNLLKDYHNRAEGLQRDKAGDILPFNPPLSRITQEDILRWKNSPAPAKESSYIDKDGKKVVVENPDPCPPRIRVMLKLKQSWLRDCYCVSIVDGRYQKIDLFHGSSVFFVREDVLRSTFEKSMTFSTTISAKKYFFEKPNMISWFPVS